MVDQGLKTYRGNCHCKAYVFETRVTEIKTVYGCNCSLCVRRASLYATPLNPADMTWIEGDETSMADYMFGAKTFHHKFCHICGTSLIGHGVSPPDGPEKPDYSVNVRTIQNIDIGKLDIEIFNGAATPPAYQAPEFTGKVPEVEIEGGQILEGNCHCGGVGLAIKTKPLHEVNDLFQSRSGATWGLFRDEQVALSGEENLTSYIRPGSDVVSERFCKICAVPISKAATEIDGKNPGKSTGDPHGHGTARAQAINVNVLKDVDMKQLIATSLQMDDK